MSSGRGAGTVIDPVRVPAAATPGRHLRLVWRANLRAPGFREPMVRDALVAVAVTAAVVALDPVLAVGWVLGVTACLGLTCWANTLLWRRGGPGRSAVVRPGGIEFVVSSGSSWYPSSSVERWVVSGPALVLQLRGHGRMTFDADGLNESDRAAIAALLAADAEPDLATPWRNVASWAATEATVKRARAARVGLVDDRWARVVPSVVLTFAVLLSLQWVVRWLTSRAALGLGEAARAATRDLPSSALIAAVVTAIWISASMWTTYRSADRRAVGVRTVVLGTDDELAVFDGTRTVTRFAWSAVATCRASADWIEIVTGRPHIVSAIPTWAFFEGERDRSVQAFERSQVLRS